MYTIRIIGKIVNNVFSLWGNSFALQIKPSNYDKNFSIMHLHVDYDNVLEVLHPWHFYM